MCKKSVSYQFLVTWEMPWHYMWIADSPHMRYNPDHLGLCQNKSFSSSSVFTEISTSKTSFLSLLTICHFNNTVFDQISHQ